MPDFIFNMDSFEYAHNITHTAMAAMAAMPRHEIDGDKLTALLQFFFETPEGETGPPFYDTDDPLFDTDDDDQVPDIDLNQVPDNSFVILLIALWYCTTSNPCSSFNASFSALSLVN